MDCNELARKLGIHQCVLGYIDDTTVYSAEQWLPLFGHVKDGKIDGTMFTGCTLMPRPVHVYSRNFVNSRAGFDNWVKHVMVNAININEAVGRVKTALNLPKEYVVKVFPALFNMYTPGKQGEAHRFYNWGEIDGVRMDPEKQEHCLMMMDYLITAYEQAFAAAAFEHITMTGFYMFDEFVNYELMGWYHALNDHIHSKGYYTMIAPYFKSKGYNLCREAKYDLVSMQSNYFLRPLCYGNSGTPDRIDLNIERGQELGIGMVPEINGDTTDGFTAYKITLKKCLEHNQTFNYHLHYSNSGILEYYNSEDPYGHSTYDELYKYIHGELKIEDIWLKEIETPQATIDRQVLRVVCDDKALTKDEWRSSVGYVKDGKITDVMFDFVVIQPPMEEVTDGKYATKTSWETLVKRYFDNLDALEPAVCSVKQLPEKEKHQVGVLFGLINPLSEYVDWGEIDGERMDPNDPIHRRRMVKYLIDACLSTMREKQYKNVRFNGFCWLDDSIDVTQLDWYVRTVDHMIDARGYCMTVPGHKAPGHEKVYRAGFGFVPMQVKGETEEELLESVRYNKSISTGVVARLASPDDAAAVKHFRLTLKSCLKAEMGDHLHLYAVGNGPRTVAAIDTALYDELYAYIKHRLTADDMIIE